MITEKTPLKTILKEGERCRQCGKCCSYSSGFATEEDITKIALKLGLTENELKVDATYAAIQMGISETNIE